MANSREELDIYNVTRLNREVRALLEGSFPAIWVEGEISNLAQPASGHIYFSLKDEYSQVRCAMFRNRMGTMKFRPENGSSVLLKANVSLYENRGEFQLIVEYMEPLGDGALQRAFEELKQKLFKEGLFDEKHKKAVPHMARRIGIITSATGAAIRDILTVFKRRYPLAEIIIYPTAVQGETAPAQIISMLHLAESRKECDVIILARGGGSLEDLWAFNNESLARAIYDCTLPTVTGIGHEIDFTIADFVTDYRAATPTAAAEIVSPDQLQLKMDLNQYFQIICKNMDETLSDLKQYIQQLEKYLPHPARIVEMFNQRLDHLSMQLFHLVKTSLHNNNQSLAKLDLELQRSNPVHLLRMNLAHCTQLGQRLLRTINLILERLENSINTASRSLEAISPQATLNRGYAIVRKQNGSVVRKATDLQQDEFFNARFAKGSVDGMVKKINRD